MKKTLLIGLVIFGVGSLVMSGCTPNTEGPAEQTKPLTDADFEKQIESYPEQAKASARAEREKAKALMNQAPTPKK